MHMGVEGALAGPVSAQEDRGVSLMEMDGGNMPIFWLVASWMVRSNSLTSSIVMSGCGWERTGAKSEAEAVFSQLLLQNWNTYLLTNWLRKQYFQRLSVYFLSEEEEHQVAHFGLLPPCQ